MPEGPEVWILSQGINIYFEQQEEKQQEEKEENMQKTISYGKHLFILDKKENWSFGLSGKLKLTNNNLCKLNEGWLYGSEIKYENINEELNKLGIDFMTADEKDIRQEIDKWIKSKKKLAGLILDQSKISGIGVAWGSEILFRAKLRPDMRTSEQNISKLADSILHIRETIKNIYEKELKENAQFSKEFVNKWFDNLYEIRVMSVYKKGTKIETLGRSWWV